MGNGSVDEVAAALRAGTGALTGRRVAFGLLGLLALSTAWGGFYEIDQGERGVVLRNGSILKVAEPGLNYKIPFLDEVRRMSTRVQVTQWECSPRGGAGCGEGHRMEMAAYSKDQQPAQLRVSVQWHVAPSQVEEAYARYGSVEAIGDRLLARDAPQAIKTVFGQFTAVSAIQDRASFNQQVEGALEGAVTGPLTVDAAKIENIDFSTVYEKSVEAAMTARVQVQQLTQQEEQEKIQASITVIKAQAGADSRLAQAKAEAESTRLRGEADASAIAAKGRALQQFPDLVSLTTAEKWNGVLPSTFVPNGAMPFIDVRPTPARGPAPGDEGKTADVGNGQQALPAQGAIPALPAPRYKSGLSQQQ